MNGKPPCELRIVRVTWAKKDHPLSLEVAEDPIEIEADGTGWVAEVQAYPVVPSAGPGQLAVKHETEVPTLLGADDRPIQMEAISIPDGSQWWIEKGQWRRRKDGGYHDASLCRHVGEARLRLGGEQIRLRLSTPGFEGEDLDALLEEFRNGAWQLILDPMSPTRATNRRADGGIDPAFLKAVSAFIRSTGRALDQPEDRGGSPLQLIVARRQCDGTPMSTREDLLVDVIERIEDAVEAGLAARGLLGRLEARHVRIWKAADSAGLVLADFVANLTYNRHRPESGAVFNELVERGRLRLFEGLGGYAERRARIAERDGDLAAALTRWALLDADAESKDGRETDLQRLWQRVLASGATGPMATLEAVLERLWRANKSPANHPRLAIALRRLEAALQATKVPPPLLYRLRNLMHQVANQMGDLPTAECIMAAQHNLAVSVADDPCKFHLILDGQVFRALTDELRLDFDAAQRHARDHLRLVEQYGTVWELLDGTPGQAGFRSSRIWLKAQMTLARALLLTGEAGDLAEVDGLLTGFDGEALADADRSRLLGYRVWLDLRGGQPMNALATATALIDQYTDPFATQMAAQATADAALLAPDHCNSELRTLLPVLRSRAEEVDGHPGELLWRDLGLLEQRITGRFRSVRLAFERSVCISDALPNSVTSQ